MAFHFIAITTMYKKSSRLAWHYAVESVKNIDTKKLSDFQYSLTKNEFGSKIAIHKITTESKQWESVVKKDAFFEDVGVMTNMDMFFEAIIEDSKPTPMDIAKIIIASDPSCKITHLKLQKLLYYVYAEFLVRFGKKLFNEPIVAYDYGPVVESVFHNCKGSARSVINLDSDMIITSISRLYALSDSQEIDTVIKDVLLRYGHCSAESLVDRTHTKNGPWDLVYEKGQNNIITDELINSFHRIVQ